LIREFYYRDQFAGKQKFLSVLLPGTGVESIPDFCCPIEIIAFRWVIGQRCCCGQVASFGCCGQSVKATVLVRGSGGRQMPGGRLSSGGEASQSSLYQVSANADSSGEDGTEAV
jgi:hypothetical protein